MGLDWHADCVLAICGLSLPFYIVRIASRTRRWTLSFGIDDAFLALSWAASVAITTLVVIGELRYGMQRPTKDINNNLVPEIVKIIWISNILCLFQTCFVKLSILLFYHRLISSTSSKPLRLALWTIVAITFSYTIVIAVLYITECLPVDAAWLRYNPDWASPHDAKCYSQGQNLGLAWATGVMDVLTTLLPICLPGWMFVQIRLSRRARVAVAMIFSLGFFVLVSSVFRAIFLVRAAQPDADRIYQMFRSIIAGKSEGDIAIICACAPSFNIFFRRYFRTESSQRNSAPGTMVETTYRGPPVRNGLVTADSVDTCDESIAPLNKSALRDGGGVKMKMGAFKILNYDHNMGIPSPLTTGPRSPTFTLGMLERELSDGQITAKVRAAQSWLNLDIEEDEDDRLSKRSKARSWFDDSVSRSRNHR